MDLPRLRIVGLWRSHTKVFTQQFLRVRQIFTLQDKGLRTTELCTRVGRRDGLSNVRNCNELVGLAALGKIVANVVDQLRRLWLALQSLGEFGVRGRIVFLRGSAISRRIVPLSRIESHQLLDDGLGLVFATAHHARRGAVVFD